MHVETILFSFVHSITASALPFFSSLGHVPHKVDSTGLGHGIDLGMILSNETAVGSMLVVFF